VNQELEAFSYSVSHDLRAPLRHISGVVTLLTQRQGVQADATAARYGRIVVEAVGKMDRLITDLLVFSRTSHAALRLQRVDLQALLEEVQHELAPSLALRCVAWEIGPLPVAEGDPHLLRLVWVNLLTNALKFTAPRPQAHIAISAALHDPGEVTISVRDNGVGFEPQYTHKLFGVFQRLHRDEEFPGTGIGLATVRRIIHRHGGRVWAEGTVDGGATFCFTLRQAQGLGHAESPGTRQL
jgi:light-regulated signal transduction histidine kinase (bacteriophytochrome)